MLTQIRNYQIIRLLGQGGMGSVYLAEDNFLGRQVAIKVLASHLVSDPKIVERFQQEAKIQAGLIHPNIIGLYNYFKEGADYYMVQEYFEGVTLKELIQRTGPIYEARALNIFNQLLEAIGYAHAKNVIHRDIKPSNILLDHNDYLKITDFGIAKIVSDKNLTKTGSKLGTVSYMSPEQVTSQKDIDARSDIYSLGMTLYEMLCGKLPFNKEDSEFNIMGKIVSGNFDSPTVFYPYISEHILNVLDLALKPDRNMRIGSTVEFINLINNNSAFPFQPAKINNNTVIPSIPVPRPIPNSIPEESNIYSPVGKKKYNGIIIGIGLAIIVVVVSIILILNKNSNEVVTPNEISSTQQESYNYGNKGQNSSSNTISDGQTQPPPQVTTRNVNTPQNVRDFFNEYASTNRNGNASRHAALYSDPTELNGRTRTRSEIYGIASNYFRKNNVENVRFQFISTETLDEGIVRVEVWEYTTANNKSEDSGAHKFFDLYDDGSGYKVIRQIKN